MIVDAAG